jgi:hypothetical protein
MHQRAPVGGAVAVPLLQAPEKYGLIAAIVDQLRILDVRDDLKKLLPDILFVRTIVRPKRSLNKRSGAWNSQANEIVGVAIGRAFDVNIYGSARDGQLRLSNDIDPFLPKRKGFESMVVLDYSGVRSF